MKLQRFFAWIAVAIGAIYFVVPLVGTLEFSLRMRRGVYSFDAYRSVFADFNFIYAFGFSMMMALLTIIFGMLLVVPTAYWVRLRLPQIRPVIEFVTLMPLVIPAIVIVFGYLRLYNSSSVLPMTNYALTTNILLLCSYIVLSLPYMYRSVDTAMRTIDVGTLTEAAESLGAKWTTIMFRCIFPNVMSGVLSGAFITLAIVMGEFTMASLLSRPAFGPYMQLMGANHAYEPSALAIIALAVTWLSMGLLQLVSRFSKSAPIKA
jgi:putative spermidine/putrescine transport system permease protein